jgi:hypothetical protein
MTSPALSRREAGCGEIVKLYGATVLLYGPSVLLYGTFVLLNGATVLLHNAGDFGGCPAAAPDHDTQAQEKPLRSWVIVIVNLAAPARKNRPSQPVRACSARLARPLNITI